MSTANARLYCVLVLDAENEEIIQRFRTELSHPQIDLNVIIQPKFDLDSIMVDIEEKKNSYRQSGHRYYKPKVITNHVKDTTATPSIEIWALTADFEFKRVLMWPYPEVKRIESEVELPPITWPTV